MKTAAKKQNRAFVLIYLLLIIFIFSVMMLPIMNTILAELRVLGASTDKEGALQIAEAGVNYYEWRLAHFPSDFTDGTGGSGPYVHDYTDFDTQQVFGKFSLTITPPPTGSTIVTIKSTGFTTKNPSIKRTITARFGIPSLAKYSFLSNDVIWIGPSEAVSGEMQSNNGVRFDGVSNAPIESAKSTYTCPSSQGSPCPHIENGVWGNASQAVKNFWKFPVPAIDFSSLTSDLANLKSAAQTAGIYLPPSNAQGYSLVFNANGTVSVYKVISLLYNPTGRDTLWIPHNEYIDYDQSTRVLQFTNPIPSNGIIYSEDKTWVEGIVKGRALVAAAQLPYNPATAPTIYIPNNITYLAKDGTNSLGLLAQKDIVVTYHAPNNLEIDAAMIAQNGGAQFFYYPGDIKNSITVFGSVMTFTQWTWTWVDGGGNNVSGYGTTNDTYDTNLLYAPPPGFPLSSTGYQLISWASD